MDHPSLIVTAVALSLLSACSGSGNCDSGDTGCSGGGTSAVVIQRVNGTCGGATCTWVLEATGQIGTVELDLVETGDPTWSCGPTSAKGSVVCGAWSEYHSNFQLSDYDSRTETKSISLNLVSDFEDQVNNVSTIFNVASSTIARQLTVMFTVTDPEGAYADCAVYGHDVGYFADYCTNNADLW
jgi:hypothetical protein